jgi:hypothetical protein
MAGLGDMIKKAQQLAGDPKVQKHLKSEKAESISDSVLDRVSDTANRRSARPGRQAPRQPVATRP